MVQDLSSLKVGDNSNVFVLLKSVENKESVNGTFQILHIQDQFEHERCVFNFGNVAIPNEIPAIVKMEVSVKEYRNEPTIHFVNFANVQNGKMELFWPKAKIDYKKSWKNIISHFDDVRPGLKDLVFSVLKENQIPFLKKALTSSREFSRKCGILEATEKLVEMADMTAKVNDLDYSIMISGAALYFIGHVEMLDDAFNSTEEEKLLGAGLLAQNKILSQKDKVDAKDFANLCHVLISRGRGIRSVTPEAIALRNLAFIVTECEVAKEERDS